MLLKLAHKSYKVPVFLRLFSVCINIYGFMIVKWLQNNCFSYLPLQCNLKQGWLRFFLVHFIIQFHWIFSNFNRCFPILIVVCVESVARYQQVVLISTSQVYACNKKTRMHYCNMEQIKLPNQLAYVVSNMFTVRNATEKNTRKFIKATHKIHFMPVFSSLFVKLMWFSSSKLKI